MKTLLILFVLLVLLSASAPVYACKYYLPVRLACCIPREPGPTCWLLFFMCIDSDSCINEVCAANACGSYRSTIAFTDGVNEWAMGDSLDLEPMAGSGCSL